MLRVPVTDVQSDFWRGCRAAPDAPTPIRAYDETGPHKLLGATQFFRNRMLFRTVFDQVDTTRERIVAFCHACSLGCEPYSLAAAWQLFFQGRRAPALKIYATDRSASFLEQARCGIYPNSALETMLPEERAFFVQAAEDSFSPNKDIRRMVEFLPAASFMDFESPEPCDLVFLLNTLCYVTAADQARTIDRIAAYNPGLFMTTGAHADRLKQDLTRNGYSPVTDNLAAIYYAWGDRFSLPPGFMIDGILHYSPALGPMGTEEDAEYRYCSIFRKGL